MSKDMDGLTSPERGVGGSVGEQCARLVEGDAYRGRYRKWRFWPGNRSTEDVVTRFADDAAAALRSLADGWQSIETMPKDELVPYLVRTPKNAVSDYVVVQASWFEGRLYPDGLDGNIDWQDGIENATHWMPRPGDIALTNGAEPAPAKVMHSPSSESVGERLSDKQLRFFARIAEGCEAQGEKTAIEDPEYGKCYPLDSLNLSQAAFAIRSLLTELQALRRSSVNRDGVDS